MLFYGSYLSTLPTSQRSKSFVKGATKDVAGQRKSHLNAGIYQLRAVAATEAGLEESCDRGWRISEEITSLPAEWRGASRKIPFPKANNFGVTSAWGRIPWIYPEVLHPTCLKALKPLIYWTQEIDRSLHPNGFKGHPGKPYFLLRRARNAWSWWENLMVILRCQMFPWSSFRDSTHETSLLIF